MIPFLKMHGLGNDFAIFDARKQTLTLTPASSRAVSDRRRGIGCDQIIVIGEGRDGADAAMRIINADGSEVEACGNAARCVAGILMAEKKTGKIRLKTAGGMLDCRDAGDGFVCVDMGAAVTQWDRIPLSCPVDTRNFTLRLENEAIEASAVSMGNPHCVLFVPDAEKVDVAGLGPRIEHHPMFPNRTNVEFVSRTDENVLRMRVWERGVGITQACGSGACAAAFSANRLGLVGNSVTVALDGGDLKLDLRDGHVLMTGPATLSFRGEIDFDGLEA